VISLAVLITDLIFMGVNYLSVRNQFDASMQEQAAQQYSAYQLAYEMELSTMVKMATLVATDPTIRRLFLEGKQAVLREGGGAGGVEADRTRKRLMEHVEATWRVSRDSFGLRQLHFHIGPGSLSFLRAHRPNKFGDRMDRLRHVIVDTNSDGKSRYGFEIGRVYSGLRGVVPVFAPEAAGGEQNQVGAVEVGAAFDHLFSVMDRQLHGGIAALLRQDQFQGKMWEDEIRNTFSISIDRCKCAVDSSSRDEIGDILRAYAGPLPDLSGKPFMLTFSRIKGRHLALTHLPLRDYLAEKRGDGSSVGRILMWRDVTAEREIYANSVRNILGVGVFGYLIIEILLYWAVRFTDSRLQRVIDEQTRDLRMLTEKAEEASRTKSTFLANMSHEIRTPMNAIIGMTQLALESAPDQRQKNYLVKIENASSTLLAIINDLLDISKIEADRLELEVADFRLFTLLEHVSAVTAVAAGEKALQFEFTAAPEVPDQLRGDPQRLEQVLLNLTHNAVKFTERGGVTLAVDLADRKEEKVWLHFSVCDTGIGIPAEHREILFEPFEQLESAVGGSYGGTGLGLAICKKLVEIMGGEIRLESTPGQGSCFHVDVPLELAGSRVAEQEGVEDSACRERLRGCRILLVEDNPLNQELATELLVRIGVQVVLAVDGEEALHTLQQQSFDGVLMDLRMPRMDGITAAREIRKQARFQDLPIIAMTANVMREDRRQVEAAGMNAHIGKPFLPHQMYCTLALHIAASDHTAALPDQARVEHHTPTGEVSGAATPFAPGPFAALTTLDTAAALERMAGEADLYRKMLRLFHEDQHDFAARFAAAVEGGDLETASRLAHTLKGSAGTIGAGALQQVALQLQLLCGDGAPADEIEAARAGVLAELAPVIADLKRFLADEPGHP